MSFREFMLQNAIKVENEKFVVSNRFVDENNEPLEWELKVISKLDEERIMKSCYKMVERNGKYINEFDELLFKGKVNASCVVYPELNNTDLQDSYRTMTDEQLLKTMLTAGEYQKLEIKLKIMGNKRPKLDEKVTEVKN